MTTQNKIITNSVLYEINKEVKEISQQLDSLDYSYPDNASLIEYYIYRLEEYEKRLEASIRQTKIANSGLRLVKS